MSTTEAPPQDAPASLVPVEVLLTPPSSPTPYGSPTSPISPAASVTTLGGSNKKVSKRKPFLFGLIKRKPKKTAAVKAEEDAVKEIDWLENEPQEQPKKKGFFKGFRSKVRGWIHRWQ
jgi:hypothetical protein